MRKLNNVRKLWEGILTMSEIRDVFTDEPVVSKQYDVDYFIPWSFVMNDELWNLMPMDSSLNSSKSNRLPKWDPFFNRFARNLCYRNEKEAFIPIVAFAGTATLKIKSKQPVIYFADIKKVVLQYQNKRFSEEEVVKLAEAISSGKMDGSLVERVQHVKNIKENISVDKEKVMNNVCPKCGGQLIQKKGKYGAFIGCSNYPECRYTMKV